MNVDNSQQYYQQFYQEAMEFKRELEDFFTHWSSYQEDEEAKARLCRLAHSLKSGGAFLHLKDLESAAHALEDLLQDRAPMGKQAKQGASKLLKLLSQPDLGGIQGRGAFPVSPEEAPGHYRETHGKGLSWLKMVTPEMLREAQERRDRLYRVDCRLQPQEMMKRARAFLILSNLEMECMVLGSIPSVENKQADFSIVSVFLFSPLTPKSIRKMADVDQVEEIRLREIPREEWSNLREKEVLQQPLDLRDSGKISMDRKDLNELAVLWEELIENLKGTRWATEKGKKLAGILRQGRAKIDQISLFPFDEMEEPLGRSLEIASQSRGISMGLEFRGGNLSLPREWQPLLMQVLHQLIRNTMVHGVEEPQERAQQGKPPQGHITIALGEEEDRLELSYRDDGRGIQREELLSKAGKLGYQVPLEDLSLKELLELRGLSSAGQLSLQGGRGVGMELVSQIVEKELQGHWTVQNLDTGCLFRIILPRMGRNQYLKFRSNRDFYLLNALYIGQQAAFNVENIWKKKNGELYYKSQGKYLPLFTVQGKVRDLSVLRSCAQWIRLEYLGRNACLAVGELLTQQSVQLQGKELEEAEAPPYPWLQAIEPNLWLLFPKLIE